MHCVACWRAGIELDGASDHGVSEALYLRGSGPERRGNSLGSPQRAMPRDANGNLQMVTDPLKLDELLGD